MQIPTIHLGTETEVSSTTDWKATMDRYVDVNYSRQKIYDTWKTEEEPWFVDNLEHGCEPIEFSLIIRRAVFMLKDRSVGQKFHWFKLSELDWVKKRWPLIDPDVKPATKDEIHQLFDKWIAKDYHITDDLNVR